MDAGSELESLSPQLPKLKFGFWLAAFLFLMEFVWAIQRELARGSVDYRSAGGYPAALFVISCLVASAYLLHCISVYHIVLGKVHGWTHPISARRAVRFHFIPIFNIYWNYKWPSEIARFVNWRTQSHRMSGFLVGGINLTGFLIAAFFDSSIGLAIVLGGFAYISRCLRDAFACAPIPQELHLTSGLDAAKLAANG